MQENTLLLIVLLCQVLLVSYYVPGRFLATVRHVVTTYPPDQYAKLYPVSMDDINTAQNTYKYANRLILVIGLALVVSGFVWSDKELLSWNNQSVLLAYFMLQFSPWIIIVRNPGITFFNLARKPDSGSKRTATLEKRKLLDFVSPRIASLAVVTYLAFVAIVLIAPDRWGAGYWNILYVLLLNVFLASMVAYHLHGRKKDPYQSHEDRLTAIRLNVNIAFFTSIIATVFLVASTLLQAMSESLRDIATSIYFQLGVVAIMFVTRVDNIDFEVYKGAPNNTGNDVKTTSRPTGGRLFFAFVFLVAFVVFFISWHHQDRQVHQSANGVTPHELL